MGVGSSTKLPPPPLGQLRNPTAFIEYPLNSLSQIHEAYRYYRQSHEFQNQVTVLTLTSFEEIFGQLFPDPVAQFQALQPLGGTGGNIGAGSAVMMAASAFGGSMRTSQGVGSRGRSRVPASPSLSTPQQPIPPSSNSAIQQPQRLSTILGAPSSSAILNGNTHPASSALISSHTSSLTSSSSIVTIEVFYLLTMFCNAPMREKLFFLCYINSDLDVYSESLRIDALQLMIYRVLHSMSIAFKVPLPNREEVYSFLDYSIKQFIERNSTANLFGNAAAVAAAAANGNTGANKQFSFSDLWQWCQDVNQVSTYLEALEEIYRTVYMSIDRTMKGKQYLSLKSSFLTGSNTTPSHTGSARASMTNNNTLLTTTLQAIAQHLQELDLTKFNTDAHRNACWSYQLRDLSNELWFEDVLPVLTIDDKVFTALELVLLSSRKAVPVFALPNQLQQQQQQHFLQQQQLLQLQQQSQLSNQLGDSERRISRPGMALKFTATSSAVRSNSIAAAAANKLDVSSLSSSSQSSAANLLLASQTPNATTSNAVNSRLQLVTILDATSILGWILQCLPERALADYREWEEQQRRKRGQGDGDGDDTDEELEDDQQSSDKLTASAMPEANSSAPHDAEQTVSTEMETHTESEATIKLVEDLPVVLDSLPEEDNDNDDSPPNAVVEEVKDSDKESASFGEDITHEPSESKSSKTVKESNAENVTASLEEGGSFKANKFHHVDVNAEVTTDKAGAPSPLTHDSPDTARHGSHQLHPHHAKGLHGHHQLHGRPHLHGHHDASHQQPQPGLNKRSLQQELRSEWQQSGEASAFSSLSVLLSAAPPTHVPSISHHHSPQMALPLCKRYDHSNGFNTIFFADQSLYNAISLIAQGFKYIPIAQPRVSLGVASASTTISTLSSAPHKLLHYIEPFELAGFLYDHYDEFFVQTCEAHQSVPATTPRRSGTAPLTQSTGPPINPFLKSVVHCGLMKEPFTLSRTFNVATACYVLLQSKLDSAMILDEDGHVGCIFTGQQVIQSLWLSWKQQQKHMNLSMDTFREDFLNGVYALFPTQPSHALSGNHKLSASSSSSVSVNLSQSQQQQQQQQQAHGYSFTALNALLQPLVDAKGLGIEINNFYQQVLYVDEEELQQQLLDARLATALAEQQAAAALLEAHANGSHQTSSASFKRISSTASSGKFAPRPPTHTTLANGSSTAQNPKDTLATKGSRSTLAVHRLSVNTVTTTTSSSNSIAPGDSRSPRNKPNHTSSTTAMNTLANANTNPSTQSQTLPPHQQQPQQPLLPVIDEAKEKQLLESLKKIRQSRNLEKWYRDHQAISPQDTLRTALFIMQQSKRYTVSVVSPQGEALGVITLQDVCSYLVQQETRCKAIHSDLVNREANSNRQQGPANQ